jgi:hypothetical protein
MSSLGKGPFNFQTVQKQGLSGVFLSTSLSCRPLRSIKVAVPAEIYEREVCFSPIVNKELKMGTVLTLLPDVV